MDLKRAIVNTFFCFLPVKGDFHNLLIFSILILFNLIVLNEFATEFY